VRLACVQHPIEARNNIGLHAFGINRLVCVGTIHPPLTPTFHTATVQIRAMGCIRG
jgi:hypothetical protein